MPHFDFAHKVERFLRTGSFSADVTTSGKKVIKTACKRFIYKDDCLWRMYRGRLLRVVKSNEEVREILARYHDNNNHMGQDKMVKTIMSLYYWGGVTGEVKKWIKACSVCSKRTAAAPRLQLCIAYGCNSSSYVHQDISFHRFPKDPERRKRWLAAAQRDEGSLRPSSQLCSRHFEPSCFTVNQEGRATLTADAVPTITAVTTQEEVLDPADENFTLEDLITVSATAETIEPSDLTTEPSVLTIECSDLALEPLEPASDLSVELMEHQYSLPHPDTDPGMLHEVLQAKRRKMHGGESCFVTYNQVARYLSHGILPQQDIKKMKGLRRMAKRFSMIDGVLMYTRVSPPIKVVRSREEVNSILRQFHDNQGHYCYGICQPAIFKQYYWDNMGRDLANWINNCSACINRTKRRRFSCSVRNCTNGGGPVERGLGLTFHKFPLHNPALLVQWLDSLGRGNWHPRLWSSVCSAHFTDDCFDRSGDKVTLRPDAVPSVFTHNNPVSKSRTSTQPAAVEEQHVFFAKYDAVERYLSIRRYPPGLTYVEKNTFRRFCKNFTIKDDQLHMVKGDRVRLVLRSRQEVETALQDYHNELNHLDLNKCLRLLNERFFWRTMKVDVIRWIDSCSQCSRAKKKPDSKMETEAEDLEVEAGSPQIHMDLDSGDDDADADADEDDGDGDEDGGDSFGISGDGDNSDDGGGRGGADGDKEEQPATHSGDTKSPVPITPQPSIPIVLHPRAPNNLQPRIPIILHPRASNNLQPRIPIILHPRASNNLQPRIPIIIRPRFPIILQPRSSTCPITKVWSLRTVLAESVGALQSEMQMKASSSEPNQPLNQNNIQFQPQVPKETPQNPSCARTQHRVHLQVAAPSLSELPANPQQETQAQTDSSGCQVSLPGENNVSQPASRPQTQTQTKADPRGGNRRSVKRKKGSQTDSAAKRTSTRGLDPVVALQQPAAEQDSRPPSRPGRLQARAVLQQCSQAKVKLKPALDGADAQWAEIQQGVVVYICFFHGASMELVQQMAETLLNARFFRNSSRRQVSILELPGSVLFIPQDSLLGELAPKGKVRYGGGCQHWWGAQLYASLVTACRELVAGSAKCAEAGVTVEHGIYGQKQEVVLNSLEPLTHLLEF